MRYFNITVNGTAYSVAVEETNAASVASTPAVPAAPVVPVVPAAPVAAAPAAAPAPSSAPVAGGEKVSAPMPGTLLDVKVAVGASVKKGDILVILEAMKMENEILAPCDGTVKQIAAKGAAVNSGDLLAVIG